MAYMATRLLGFAHPACVLHRRASGQWEKPVFISSFSKSICTAQVQGWALKIETWFCVMWHGGNPLASLLMFRLTKWSSVPSLWHFLGFYETFRFSVGFSSFSICNRTWSWWCLGPSCLWFPVPVFLIRTVLEFSSSCLILPSMLFRQGQLG